MDTIELGGVLIEKRGDAWKTMPDSTRQYEQPIRFNSAVTEDCLDETPWGGPAVNNPVDGQIVELDSSNREIWSWSTEGHVDSSGSRTSFRTSG